MNYTKNHPFQIVTLNIPHTELEIEPTLWRTVSDLTNKDYYFNAATNMNFIWVNLKQFNLSAGAPIMQLNLADNSNLMGNVFNSFK